MPDNVQPLSNLLKPDLNPPVKVDNEKIIAQIKADISKLKNGTKILLNDFNDAVEGLKSRMESSQRFLPKFVASHRHQMTHINKRVLLYAPAARWRTICGWHCYCSSYQFSEEDNAVVSCTKCLGIAQSKEGGKCGSSKLQLHRSQLTAIQHFLLRRILGHLKRVKLWGGMVASFNRVPPQCVKMDMLYDMLLKLRLTACHTDGIRFCLRS